MIEVFKLMIMVVVLATLVIIIGKIIDLDERIKELENEVTNNKINNDSSENKKEINLQRKLFNQLLSQLNKKVKYTHDWSGLGGYGHRVEVVDLTLREKRIKEKEEELEKLKGESS